MTIFGTPEFLKTKKLTSLPEFIDNHAYFSEICRFIPLIFLFLLLRLNINTNISKFYYNNKI